MNVSDNYCSSHRIKLFSRNEGKIKSYGSCSDLRAWSHVDEKRDLYLKEWIKSDMPTCVIPTGTLIYIIKKMTCQSKVKTIPRCHQHCKSKAVLESICTSCHAMKECFKNQDNYDKYFDNEEFETSNWPCERCLEALKSIKFFWKIIVDKIFNVKVSKNEELSQSEISSVDSVRSVAKLWQANMLQEARFIRYLATLKNNNGPVNRALVRKAANSSNSKPYECKDIVKTTHVSNCSSDNKDSKGTITQNLNKVSCKSTCTSTMSVSRKVCRHTFTTLEIVDVGTQCNNVNYKNSFIVKLDTLEDKCREQEKEINHLKRQNGYLKHELQNIYQNPWWKFGFSIPFVKNAIKNEDKEALSEPSKSNDCKETESNAEPIDSEMIITMKNCQNKNYRHISLLQVLHKSNTPDFTDVAVSESICKKEDPLKLLTKVQDKFTAIVSREMGLAKNRNCLKEDIDIEASYHSTKGCKSDPHCSTTALASVDSILVYLKMSR